MSLHTSLFTITGDVASARSCSAARVAASSPHASAFWGGVDLSTGIVIDRSYLLHSTTITDRVLVRRLPPSASAPGPRAARGAAPAAIARDPDDIIAIG